MKAKETASTRTTTTSSTPLETLALGVEAAELAARRAATLGWTPGTGGNLSLDLGPERPPRRDGDLLELRAAVPGLAGHLIFVSRSGARFRDLRGDRDLGLVRVLPEGDRAEAWFPDDERPTFELDAHLAIHAARQAIDAPATTVLHVHPPHLVALTQVEGHDDPAALEAALLGAHPEIAYQLHAGIGLVPYQRSGGDSIALRSAEIAARGIGAIVWARHGCMTAGDDLDTCFDRAELLEAGARIRLAALATGRPVEGLGPSEIEAMRRLHDLPAWAEGDELA